MKKLDISKLTVPTGIFNTSGKAGVLFKDYLKSALKHLNVGYTDSCCNETFVAEGQTSGGGLESVTGFGVDNTDPLNPIVNKYTSGNLAATGTDLSDAAQIVATSTIITSGASASGVKLPTGAALNNTYYVALGSALNVFIYSNGVNFIVNGVNVGTSYQLSKLQFFYEFRFNGFGWVVSEEQVAPYKVYSALLTNSSGTVTAIQLQNTIGNGSGDGTNDIAWTNPSNGIIRGTMSAGTPFTTDKVWAVSPTLDASSNAYFVGNRPYNFAPNNSYDFVIRLHDNTQASTPNFSNYPIEIRVYN